jgi:hypothetical protein
MLSLLHSFCPCAYLGSHQAGCCPEPHCSSLFFRLSHLLPMSPHSLSLTHRHLSPALSLSCVCACLTENLDLGCAGMYVYTPTHIRTLPTLSPSPTTLKLECRGRQRQPGYCARGQFLLLGPASWQPAVVAETLSPLAPVPASL